MEEDSPPGHSCARSDVGSLRSIEAAVSNMRPPILIRTFSSFECPGLLSLLTFGSADELLRSDVAIAAPELEELKDSDATPTFDAAVIRLPRKLSGTQSSLRMHLRAALRCSTSSL